MLRIIGHKLTPKELRYNIKGIIRKGILIYQFIFHKTRIKRISAVHTYLHVCMCRRLPAADSIMLFKKVLYITGYQQISTIHEDTPKKSANLFMLSKKFKNKTAIYNFDSYLNESRFFKQILIKDAIILFWYF